MGQNDTQISQEQGSDFSAKKVLEAEEKEAELRKEILYGAAVDHGSVGRILALLPPIHVSLLTGGDFCS